MGVSAAGTTRSKRSSGGASDRDLPEQAASFATMMVHVDVVRDCEQRIQVALALADRFAATLIGVAGLTLPPTFAAGGVAVYPEPATHDLQRVSARLDELGKKFCAQGRGLEKIEWRTALEFPDELVAREARAADLVIVGSRRRPGNSDLADPGAILLRTGRPVLVVPDIVAPPRLHRVVVACKDTRECRRAVYDALPFLWQAKEVVLVAIDEDGAESKGRRMLADIASYLMRHKVIVAGETWLRARGPAAAGLLQVAADEKADLIVAGGYGHSRLGEWIFGGVTHELLASSTMCCMLSH
jgi:nucleotide-binding universal stress UspA family protein